MKSTSWATVLLFVMIGACVAAQDAGTDGPGVVGCVGCTLKFDVDPALLPEGVTIDVAWNEAKPGTCDSDKCKGSACDFSSVRVTVTNAGKVELWALDGDWHKLPVGLATTWGYEDEPVECGGGHRVRLYPKDDQTTQIQGSGTLACSACEATIEEH